MVWTFPNFLTLLRLVAAPGLAVVFLYFARPWADWYALILFVLASLTDFVDGWLARRWQQVTAFGRMMDPIADKAMVMIALLMIVAFSGLEPLIVLPATIIMFREVFVSGLREFLGDRAGELKVTGLAKWKTTVQMIAIAVLFSQGLFVHYFEAHSLGMSREIVQAVLAGTEDDIQGLRWKYQGVFASYWGGVGLLWVAAGLTLITGVDYFRKAVPHMRSR